MQPQHNTAVNINARPRSWAKTPLATNYLRARLPDITAKGVEIFDFLNRVAQIQARGGGPDADGGAATAYDIAAACDCGERCARYWSSRLRAAGLVAAVSTRGRHANVYSIPGGYVGRKPAATATAAFTGTLHDADVSMNRTLHSDAGSHIKNAGARQYRNRNLEKKSGTVVITTGLDKNFPRSHESTTTTEPRGTQEQTNAKTANAGTPRKQPAVDNQTAAGALRAREVSDCGITSCFALVRDYGTRNVMGAVEWFDAERARRRRTGRDDIGPGLLVHALRKGIYATKSNAHFDAAPIPKKHENPNDSGSVRNSDPVTPPPYFDPAPAHDIAPISAPRGWSPAPVSPAPATVSTDDADAITPEIIVTPLERMSRSAPRSNSFASAADLVAQMQPSPQPGQPSPPRSAPPRESRAQDDYQKLCADVRDRSTRPAPRESSPDESEYTSWLRRWEYDGRRTR